MNIDKIAVICYITPMDTNIFKIRGIQFSPILGNISKNAETHFEYINKAINDRINLIIFPELSLTGYHMKDIAYDVSISKDSSILNSFCTMSLKIDIVIGAVVEEEQGIIYNCGLYFSKGKLQHIHRKVQLPNFGMFEEAMIFKPGDTFKSFKIADFTAGIIICREILFPINAYLYFLQGVDFLIGISNSPFRGLTPEGMSSLKLWERMGEVFSIHYHQNYVFINRSGFEDGFGFGGGSFFAQPGKGIVKKAKYYEDDILDFEINPHVIRTSRIGGNYLRDEDSHLIFREMKRILNA